MTKYYDPKNEPGGDKKLLLAIVLVVIGVVVMNYLTPKPSGPPAQPNPAPQTVPAPTPVSPPASNTADARKPGKAVAPPVARNVPVKQGTSETETIVENPNYRIVFTNRGATVKSWILKKYKNDKGQELDLVNPITAPVLGYPLSLFTYDADLKKKVNEALYVPGGVGKQFAPTSLTFAYNDGEISVEKKFTFYDSPEAAYVVGIETSVTQNGRPVAALTQWPGGFGDQTSLSSYAGVRIDWQQNGKVTRKTPQSGWFLTGKSWVIGGQTINGPFEWVGTLDGYFAAVFMPESPYDANLVTLHTQVQVPKNPDKPQDGGDKVSVLGTAVGSLSGATRQRIFVGPKEIGELEKVEAQPGGPDLRGIVDFGMFGFIARPLFLWLKWTHGHWIPNWGWAIVFLTIVINGALLPLRISSMKSSLKMQKIQPQVKAINEKYKRYKLTDPRRAPMQQEISELYKREGVSPVGGCFPMLLQMPFLFAFYSMLGNAIDLRQAGWLWIHDLSAADPSHILPIVIMVTMFLSSKSMPQAGMDPVQQRMMQVFTPLMLGLISWNLAAGLGIYWAISNMLMWVQQIVINRTKFGKQVRKTVEKRASKKSRKIG